MTARPLRPRSNLLSAATTVTVLALMIVPGLGLSPTVAGAADEGLLGYTIHASAPVAQVVWDSSMIPSPSHPVFTGTLPEATADLSTGPSGHGFAAVAWPGPLAGNLGTTIQQLNQLCAPGTLTSLPVIGPFLQCLPVTDQEKQLLKGTNDPVRADAKAPAGPADASYGAPGALYMTAHAAGAVVSADAGMTALHAEPVLSVASTVSHASATVIGSLAVGEATSTLAGIAVGTDLSLVGSALPQSVPGSSLAGPLLRIDSLRTTVKVSSDGNQGKSTGGIVFDGVSVLGMPATIDDRGLHVGGQDVGLDSVLGPAAAAAQQALTALQFTVAPLAKPLLTVDGTAGTATVSGLVITFVTPDGASWRLTLGMATARADASPNISFDLPASPTGPDIPASVGGLLTDVLGTSLGAGTGGLSAPSAGRAAGRVTGYAAAFRGPIPGGKHVGVPLVLAAVAAAAVLAFGLLRLSRGLLAEAAPATRCPNRGRPS